MTTKSSMTSSGRFCFDEAAFAADEFDINAFLEDMRTDHPMETIHHDLQQFQTSLENQLVAIINRDYAEFLQLSSKLRGVDEAVSNVRSPILAILERVEQVQSAMTKLRSRIQEKETSFVDLDKQESDLNFRLHISDTIFKLENLLELNSDVDDDIQNDDGTGSEQDEAFDNFDQIKKQLRETSAEENCAALEHAARGIVHLEHELSTSPQHLHLQREEKQLQFLEDALLSRLEAELSTEIVPDSFYRREHQLNAKAISSLLHAYVLLDQSKLPEEMIARLIVIPFAETSLTRSKLDDKVRNSCQGLPQVYASILDFISSKFGQMLQDPITQGFSKKESVDLLGNCIWGTLSTYLSDKFGSSLFRTADPDQFHRTYKTSCVFLDDMTDRFCADTSMKERFKAHESVTLFLEKWNMDVYFQLRFTQISTVLETSYEGTAQLEENDTSYHFQSSNALIQAMRSCYDETIFLLPVLPKLVKLNVQLFESFVLVWKEEVAKGRESKWLEKEEDVMKAGSDFSQLKQEVEEVIVPIVQQHVKEFTDDAETFVIQLFQASISALKEMETRCWEVAVTSITEECKKVVPALRTVKGQYQMTKKPPPTTASTYVVNIVRPMERFLNDWGQHFSDDQHHHFLSSVCESICEAFGSVSKDLLKAAVELEESLKSRKRHSGKTFSSEAASSDMSDATKMKLQLQLDFQDLHRRIQELGFNLEECSSYAMTASVLEDE